MALFSRFVSSIGAQSEVGWMDGCSIWCPKVLEWRSVLLRADEVSLGGVNLSGMTVISEMIDEDYRG